MWVWQMRWYNEIERFKNIYSSFVLFDFKTVIIYYDNQMPGYYLGKIAKNP